MAAIGARPSSCATSRRVASIRIDRGSVDRARARSAANERGSQHGSIQISQRIPWELAGSQVSPHSQGGRGSQARCHGQAGSRREGAVEGSSAGNALLWSTSSGLPNWIPSGVPPPTSLAETREGY